MCYCHLTMLNLFRKVRFRLHGLSPLLKGKASLLAYPSSGTSSSTISITSLLVLDKKRHHLDLIYICLVTLVKTEK